MPFHLFLSFFDSIDRTFEQKKKTIEKETYYEKNRE
jgi:hypothetical protein